MTEHTAPQDVKWAQTSIIKIHDNPPASSQWLYNISLPDWLAEWDVFANWERERFASMAKHLTKKDILLDIGAEVGWQSVIYAQFVGPRNMVLVEPSSEFWPNIQATWKRNFGKQSPLGCYYGLFGDKTTSKFVLPLYTFPAEAEGELTHRLTYRYIHEHGLRMPQIKLDDYVKLTGIKPGALTMDVEGAELLILKGAEQTLRKYKLKVWVSIHEELGQKDYNVTPDMVITYMEGLGYTGKHLATDHEQHWYFRKLT